MLRADAPLTATDLGPAADHVHRHSCGEHAHRERHLDRSALLLSAAAAVVTRLSFGCFS